MSKKSLQAISAELQRIVEEHETLITELRRHPRCDDHIDAVLVQQLVISGDDAVRQSLETSIQILTTQHELMKQLLSTLDPIPPVIRSLLN